MIGQEEVERIDTKSVEKFHGDSLGAWSQSRFGFRRRPEYSSNLCPPRTFALC